MLNHPTIPQKSRPKIAASPQVEPLELPPEATERQHLEMMARQSSAAKMGGFLGIFPWIFPRKSGQFMGNLWEFVSNLWQLRFL